MLDILSAVFGFVVSNKYYLLSAFTLLVMVRAILFRGVFDPKKYPDSFVEYKDAIRTEKWGEQYLSWLRKLSNWLTNLIGDHHRFPEQAPPKQPFWQHLKNNNPWTAESYEFCLKLSFVYPTISIAVAWVLGGDGVLGGQAIYDAEVSWYWRISYGVSILVATLLGFFAVRASSWKRLLLYIIGVFFIGAFPLFLSSSFAFFLAVLLALGLMLDGVLALAFALSITVAIADIGSLAFISSVVVGGSMEGLHELARKFRKLFIFWLFYLPCFFLISFVSLRWIESELALILLLVLVLLPLANSLVDWLSLGVTRHLLQRLQVDNGWSHAVLWAVIDLMLALVFLFLISIVLVGVVSVANVFAVNSVLDLKAVFASLRDTSDHRSDFWVYFLLFSTLIPTLIHFSLVGGALTRSVPASWRQRMVDGIGKHEHRTWEAYAYLVFTPAVGFVLAPALLLSLLWWIASTHGGVIGFGLLNMAEWLALWIDPTLGHVEVPTSTDR